MSNKMLSDLSCHILLINKFSLLYDWENDISFQLSDQAEEIANLLYLKQNKINWFTYLDKWICVKKDHIDKT